MAERDCRLELFKDEADADALCNVQAAICEDKDDFAVRLLHDYPDLSPKEGMRAVVRDQGRDRRFTVRGVDGRLLKLEAAP